MSVIFPANPTTNQTYTYGNRSWIWAGTYWRAISVTPGYTGSVGYTGSASTVIGYTGSTGYTGSSGASVYIGYTGSTGAGYTGSIGYVGSASTVVGYTGSQGLGYTGSIGIGYTGSASTVIGYTGSKGDIGYTGSQGAGYTGSASTVVGYTGSQGVGYTGSIGIGYTGSASTAQGPIGYSGSIGATGATGSAGTSGVARATITATTASIANLATGNVTATGYKSYVLFKIQTSCEAWVRIYTDSASRTSDSSRSIGTDPTPGSGVITEILTTTGYLTQLITPGIFGFNNDGTPTTNIYLAVTNYNASSQAVTVTLTVIQMEL